MGPTGDFDHETCLKWLGLGLRDSCCWLGALFVNVWYFKPLRIDWFYAAHSPSLRLTAQELLSSLRILPRWLDFYGADLDDASPAADQKGRR